MKIQEVKQKPQRPGLYSPTQYNGEAEFQAEDKVEKLDTSVKKNVKSKKLQEQKFQEIWNTMKDQIYE